jgi:hypothetical protein
MIERMTHAEYVAAVRKEAASTAAGIVEGTVNVVEGARTLTALRHDAEVDAADEDFAVFAAIASDTDALPFGEVRKHWSAEALARLEPELRAAVAWAMPIATPACHSIMRRFGA